VGEYVGALLARAQSTGAEPFLRACAGAFERCWRLVGTLQDVAGDQMSALACEDVVCVRLLEGGGRC
jgi:hypothetical protein